MMTRSHVCQTKTQISLLIRLRRLGPRLPTECPAKTLIRLRGSADWSSLDSHTSCDLVGNAVSGLYYSNVSFIKISLFSHK